MKVEAPTSELPGGVSFLIVRERPVPLQRRHQTARTDVIGRGELLVSDPKQIARAEMARRRRRLGALTPDQETAIENLLLSTVTRISELVERGLQAERDVG